MASLATPSMFPVMWIISPDLGLLSIVVARRSPDDPTPDPNHLNVRARRRTDLERFQALHPDLDAMEIQVSGEGRDYPFRLVPVPKTVMAEAMAHAVATIGYTNVKAEAQRRGLGERFLNAMHRVWAAMLQVQAD